MAKTQTDPADQPLWWVTAMKPFDVTPEMLGAESHARQVRIYGRAKTRAEFARKIIAAGLDRRSPAAVSAWIGNNGSTTGNADDLAAIIDGGVYLRALDGAANNPFLAYPLQS